jgi:hypothetical protein
VARRNEEVPAHRLAHAWLCHRLRHPWQIDCLLHGVRCTLSAPHSPRWHSVCCMSPTTRCPRRLLHVVACTLSATCFAQLRTSARTPPRMRARMHTRAHTRACESMRIAMVGNGTGAGGSQEGGRGAAPVATSLSCACRRRHGDRTTWCLLAAARLSGALLLAAACRRLHCRFGYGSSAAMSSAARCPLHVVCRTLSRCISAFRSIRRVWCTFCVTAAAARFLLLGFRCPLPSCTVPAARRLRHVACVRLLSDAPIC